MKYYNFLFIHFVYYLKMLCFSSRISKKFQSFLRRSSTYCIITDTFSKHRTQLMIQYYFQNVYLFINEYTFPLKWKTKRETRERTHFRTHVSCFGFWLFVEMLRLCLRSLTKTRRRIGTLFPRIIDDDERCSG